MLTPKKKRFAEEYLVDLNATQAAIRAGYSAHSAKEQGHRLLTDDHVKAIVQQHQKSLSIKAQISKESLLADLEYLKEKNKDANPMVTLKAVELQSRLLGLFTDKLEINVSSHRRIIDQIKMRQVNPIKVDEDDE